MGPGGGERGRQAVTGSGGINADNFGIERKMGVVGRGGDTVGKSGGQRACHGGGGRAAGRLGQQRAAALDRRGGSVLRDRRREKADWAFWAERLLGPDCATGPS
jgi:hypothetical protein